ncbi:hypothetical protein SprV_0902763700 [Sparganum proliferum]
MCTLIIFIVFILIGLSLVIPGAVLVAQNPISFGTSFGDFDLDESFEKFDERTDQEIKAKIKFIGGCVLIVLGIIFLLISIVMGSCAAGFAVASRRDFSRGQNVDASEHSHTAYIISTECIHDSRIRRNIITINQAPTYANPRIVSATDSTNTTTTAVIIAIFYNIATSTSPTCLFLTATAHVRPASVCIDTSESIALRLVYQFRAPKYTFVANALYSAIPKGIRSSYVPIASFVPT